MYTRSLINAAIAAELGINPVDWVVSSREGFTCQSRVPFQTLPSLTKSINLERRAADDKLSDWSSVDDVDTSGDNVVVVKNIQGEVRVQFVTVSNGTTTTVRKQYAERFGNAFYNTRTIRQIEDKIFVEIFNSQYEEIYRLNWAQIQASSTLMAQVRASYAAKYPSAGVPTDPELIRHMATSTWIYVRQEQEINEEQTAIKLVVTPTGNPDEVRLVLDTEVDGIDVQPWRHFVQIYPTLPILGTPNTTPNKGAGAAFSFRKSTVLSTNLFNRKAEHILNPKDVKVEAFATLQDSKGNNVYCKSGPQIIDLSENMKTYDYFGLVAE